MTNYIINMDIAPQNTTAHDLLPLTGDISKAILNKGDAFYMIKALNSISPIQTFNLKNGDTYQLKVSLDSSKLNMENIFAAPIFTLDSWFYTSGGSGKENINRAYFTQLPFSVDNESFKMGGNAINMLKTDQLSNDLKTGPLLTDPISVVYNQDEALNLSMQISGLVGLQVSENGSFFYVPISHDPIMIITTGEH